MAAAALTGGLARPVDPDESETRIVFIVANETRATGKTGALRTLLLVLGVLGAAWAYAQQFPYNGDFEAGAEAPGWRLTGAWEVKAEAARTGRVGLLLAAAATGDSATTSGYLPAKPGDTLRLRLSYVCPAGGLQVGLQPCDTLGRPCAEPVAERLPAVDAWADVDKRLELPAALPVDVASVRLVLSVQQAEVRVQVDAITLSRLDVSAPQKTPELPPLDLTKTSNLLPRLDTFGSSASAWSAVSVPGYGTGQVGRNPAPAGVTLTGGETRCGIISRRQVLDCSVPYEVAAEVDGRQWQSGRLVLLGRWMDPAYPGVCWHQSESSLLASEVGAPLQLSLPRLGARPTPGLLQVALLLDSGAVGKVAISGVTMRLQVMSLGVRLAANAKPGPENVTLFVSAANNTDQPLKPTCWLKTMDMNGQTVHVEKRTLTVGARSAAYFPYAPKLPGVGNFRMLARVLSDGQDFGSATFAFRVKTPEILGGMETVGARRVSAGYLRVLPTETVQLSLAYRGREGGPMAGLLLCDPLGRPLGADLVMEVPPSLEWTPHTTAFDLAQVKLEAGVVGAVRPFTRLPEAPDSGDFDALAVANLTTPPRPMTSLVYPLVDLKRPANLLPPLRPEEVQRGRGEAWAPWVGLSFAPGNARLAENTSLTAPVFVLEGGQLAAGWLAAPLVLDGSVPYTFTLSVDTTQLTEGTGCVMARFLDPQDPNAVVWQQLVQLRADGRARDLALSIPRQFTEGRAEVLQLGVVLDAGASGVLTFTRPELRPEALTVSLRPGVVGAGAANPLMPQVFCSAVNNGSGELRPDAIVTVTDSEGKQVHSEKRAIVIGARSAAHFPFVLRLPAAGDYEVRLLIVANGKELGSATMALSAPPAGEG